MTKQPLLRLVLSALLLGATGLQSLDAQTAEQEQRRLTVMSYNVKNGTGLDGRTDYRRIADAIRHAQADVVAIQEVDSMTGRSGGRYVLGEIAAKALMYPTFAPAIPYDGGKYGIGLLSRERPLAVRRIALPGREEARTLLVAEFQDYIMACTHLSLTEEDRMASLAVLRTEAARARKPFFLAGDWNDMPASPFLTEIKKDFTLLTRTDRATYPANEPKDCIDYIAMYKRPEADYALIGAYVPDEPTASDHRPVVARLQGLMPADRLLYHDPYLQNPTPTAATVMYQTRASVHSYVEFGTDTLHLRRARMLRAGQEVVHDVEHRVRLDSLTPGATYYYRVCATEIVKNQAYSKAFGRTAHTAWHRFTLPPAEGTESDFTAIVLNDLHNYRPTISAFSRLAKDICPDFIIFNGDCLSEPIDRDHAIREVHAVADSFDLADRFSVFVRGNHEIRNAYSSGMPTLFDNAGGKTYGGFSWGDTRFVVLDLGEDKPDDTWVYYGLNDFDAFRREQVDFLRTELRSKPFRRAEHRILIHHIPIWGNGDKYQPCPPLWTPLLDKAPFTVDLTAHVHSYEVFPTGTIKNPFPVIRGGGPNLDSATMAVLRKRGKELTLTILDTKGRVKDTFTY